MSTIGYTDGAEYFKRYLDVVAKSLFGPQGRASPNPGVGRCDYLVYSYWGSNHSPYLRNNCKVIFISGEPSNNSKVRCHLILDCKNIPRLRPPNTPFLYLPFYVVSFWERFHHQPHHLIKQPTPDWNPEVLLKKRTKFCAFLYSRDIPERNRLYDFISTYKKVTPLGSCRNPNPKAPNDRRFYKDGVCTFFDLAVEKYRPFKFAICCENTRQPGYITEKIINCMLAKVVPIYWGAQDVTKHFNPKSFIDMNSFPSKEAALQYIKRVDQDDILYKEMLAEPWFVGNKLPQYFSGNYCRDALKKLRASTLVKSSHRTKQVITTSAVRKTPKPQPKPQLRLPTSVSVKAKAKPQKLQTNMQRLKKMRKK